MKSLRVDIDEYFTFYEHVQNVCKASYHHIHGLWHIRAAMSKDTACTVASAIVSSRLDKCNALLVVPGTCRHDHISPVLEDL